MSISFIHLSDIHFGQERTTGDLITHDDVKQYLIKDARKQASGLNIIGIIVTGDIAYSGKNDEFKEAGKWLDDLSDAVGCASTDVQVVPGNHDIDRNEISTGCRLMIKEVVENGEEILDGYLDNPADCEELYRKLRSYLSFAEGYNCHLDKKGGIASNKTFRLAPDRRLRFVGMNSAIMCYGSENESDLVLGARQRVLHNEKGEEVVVLCHHPLHWFKDSEKARNYIRNRARVLLTGHEHTPTATVDNVKGGCDLLSLASGAAVPPKADEEYRYTYNILTFDWDAEADALTVTVDPRTWSETETEFVADVEFAKKFGATIKLGSPNFREAAAATHKDDTEPHPEPEEQHVQDEVVIVEESTVPQRHALVLLKFFRDLTPAQRLEILVRLDALPPKWQGTMSLAMERMVVDKLVHEGRIAQLEEEIVRAQDSHE